MHRFVEGSFAVKMRPFPLVLIGLAVAYLAVWGVYEIKLANAPGTSIESANLGPAPDVAIASQTKELRLSSLKGKVVLLDFWATWCGPCVESVPNVQRFYNNYKSKGFEVMGVALEKDDGSKLPIFIESNKVTYPVGVPVDPEEAAAYHPDSIPTAVLIDKKGVMRYRHEGAIIGDAPGKIAKMIEQLLAE